MSCALREWSQHPDGFFAAAWCKVGLVSKVELHLSYLSLICTARLNKFITREILKLKMR